MKIKKIFLMPMIVAVFLIFSGCQNTNIINTPNIINLYVDGKQKQITKSGNQFEQVLFDRIIFLINVRLPQQQFSEKMGRMSDNNITQAKAYSVEYIYDKPQKIIIGIGNKRETEIAEIIFPLSEKWENTAFLKEKDNTYAKVSLKENLDYLVKASVR